MNVGSKRRGPSRWRVGEADLDFHSAVVEAADNSLLAHVDALIRVALAASGGSSDGASEAARRAAALRADVARAIRAGEADSAEAAMIALVDLDWNETTEES